jgi:hypothetical protein
MSLVLPNGPTERLISDVIAAGGALQDLRKHDRTVWHDPKIWGYFRDKNDRDGDGNTAEYTSTFPCDRARSHGTRKASRVTAIMLHTTDVEMGWRRFVGVPAPMGVSDDDVALLLFDLLKLLYHGDAANGFSVGLEISGRSACTPTQVLLARALVRYAQAEILAAGGGVNGRVAIMCHAMSQGAKPNDCGKQIWQDVGEWAISELGCVLGPVVGTGRPIDDWRPAA